MIDMTTQTETQSKINFGPRRIGHANLFVGELEESIRFYRDVCGFDLVFREPHLTMGFLSNGNTHHDLGLVEATQRELTGIDGHVQVKAGRGTKPGLNHFGWEMENERLLVDAFDRVRKAKFPIVRMSDHQISHSIYINDPDGNLHEFYADQMKNWRTLFNGTAGPAITSAWNPKTGSPTTDPRYPQGDQVTRVDHALIQSVRFTHAVLVTKQFEAMLDFYQNVAGLQVVHRTGDDFACFGARHSGYLYDIAIFQSSTASGVHHYSYQVASKADLDSAVAKLSAANIPIEKRVDERGKRSLFIRDPDGMLCEFYVSTINSRQEFATTHVAPSLYLV